MMTVYEGLETITRYWGADVPLEPPVIYNELVAEMIDRRISEGVTWSSVWGIDPEWPLPEREEDNTFPHPVIGKILEDLERLGERIDEVRGKDIVIRAQRGAEVHTPLKKIRDRLAQAPTWAAGFDYADEATQDMQVRLYVECLDIEPRLVHAFPDIKPKGGRHRR